MKQLITIIFSLLLLSLPGNSQKRGFDPNKEFLEEYTSKNPQEKLFIHTDKNFWVAGETSWFKIYLVSGQSHQPINTSKVAYVELVGSENQILLQTKIELSNGFGKGQINIPASVSSGNYYLRAYTRWMKNYSADFFFHQPITIVNTFRRLFDGEQQPNSDIDVQFFPEGGQWIDGINHKIAFRAVDYLGKGIDFTGTIINSNGDTLNQFKPAKFGMGTFEMKPTLQEYTALINHKGKTTAVKLPKVNATGFALQIVDTLSQFKILIKTKGVFDQPVYILAHTRQKVNFTFSQPLKNGALELMIPKSNLEAGITHITVFTSIGQPVCERLIFLKPEDNTVLSVSTDREQTSTRKKIMLDLKSKNTTLSNLSISVMRNDSLQQFVQPDIVSYLLLSSDLKGSIESPHAYLNANPEIIDNLMLTHGWSRFRWEELAEPKTIQHIPEYRAQLIEPTTTDNQPLKPGTISYVSTPGKKIELGGVSTNKSGISLIEANYLSGVSKLILQSPYEKAKLEIKSPYSSSFIRFNLTPINLSEKDTQALVEKSISMQVNDAFEKNDHVVLSLDSSTFYGTAPETYLLDDYTRFPVMEEVMREYVKSVWVRKKDDQFIFKIVDRDRGNLLDGELLVLLDGVPIFNVNDIMAFDPLKVKQLDVLPGRYFVGSLAFDGIVSYRTYKGDLGGFKFSPETVIMNYDGLQQQKQFYSPRYETVSEINSRIPDGRHLLYWNPDVHINGSVANQLEFYTSDQPGTYKVTVQGIAADGTPLFGETTFKVVR
jgi:hypothetical protein